MSQSYRHVKPFLKWVGGKTQILPEIRKRYPAKFDNYYEPFLGAGAVFLDVIANFDVKNVYASETNTDLVNLWNHVVNRTERYALCTHLEALQSEYYATSSDMQQALFLHKRTLFNSMPASIEKSALFIFLNKTCFNGLYRTNQKNEFNVPFGKYQNPKIYEKQLIHDIGDALKTIRGVKILNQDALRPSIEVDNSYFIYVDPPYRPVSKTSFTGYQGFSFTDEQQRELAQNCNKWAGAKILISNSDAGDGFFEELYKGWHIERIKERRAVSASKAGRKPVSTLLIRNYL